MNRVETIDMVRGFSIFGMILSGIIPRAVLPPSMYHAQLPPPLHRFEPSLAGITWVDLVFPLFIFCLGLSIPLALSKSLKKNSVETILKKISGRYLKLIGFAILIKHYMNYGISKSFWSIGDFINIDLQLYSILGLLSLFLMLSNKPILFKKYERVVGLILTLILLSVLYFVYEVPLSLQKNDIIIIILANVYLFASISYVLWKKGTITILPLSMIWLAVIGCIQVFSLEIQWDKINWFFQPFMISYLLLAFPAMVLADNAISSQKNINTIELSRASILYTILVVVMVILTFVLLQGRFQYLYIYGFTFLAVIAMVWGSFKYSGFKNFLRIGAVLLTIGILIEQCEGGIKKDPVTLSYLLVMGALSILTLFVMAVMNGNKVGQKAMRLFKYGGENALMAYVSVHLFMMPFLNLTGLSQFYHASIFTDHPWLGFTRSVVATLVLLSLIAIFSKRKLYWKI